MYIAAHSGKYYKCTLEYLGGQSKQSEITKHVISLEELRTEQEMLLFNYFSYAEPPLVIITQHESCHYLDPLTIIRSFNHL